MGIKDHSEIVLHRRGVPVYRSNPSVPNPNEISRVRRAQIGDAHKGIVVDNGTGEILGGGGAIAYQWEEVDQARFVKLYLEGLKQAAGPRRRGRSRTMMSGTGPSSGRRGGGPVP